MKKIFNLKTVAPGARSAAVTRVKKHKKGLVEREPPLKRARQKVEDDKSKKITTNRTKRMSNGIQDKDYGMTNEKKLQKLPEVLGCQWPSKMEAGDPIFRKKVCWVLPS